MKVKKLTKYSILIISIVYVFNLYLNKPDQELPIESSKEDTILSTQNSITPSLQTNNDFVTTPEKLFFVTNKEIDDSFIEASLYPFFTDVKLEMNNSTPISFSAKLHLTEFDIIPLNGYFEDSSLVLSSDLFMINSQINEQVNEETETMSIRFNIYSPSLNIRRENYRILVLNEKKVDSIFERIVEYQKERELEVIQHQQEYDQEMQEVNLEEPMEEVVLDETNSVDFQTNEETNEHIIY